MTDTDLANEKVEGIPLVAQETAEYLNEKQLVDYGSSRRAMLNWFLTRGKAPAGLEGYAHDTVRVSASHLDVWSRWVWQTQTDGYTAHFTHALADEYMAHLKLERGEEVGDYYRTAVQRSLKRYFKYREYERNGDPWDPKYKFSDPTSTQPRDYFTIPERRKLREGALEYGSVPHYKTLDPEGREEWKQYLAMRFEKPKSEITPRDFKRANGWKFTSLVWATLDAGFRPVEVGRARTGWFQVEDVEEPKIIIPQADSAKGDENWSLPLTERTGRAVRRWLTEREMYEKYDDTDAMWLTREGNPYESSSLNYLIRNLCREAGIGLEGRKISWYAIRHSVGTHMTNEKSLKHAKKVLRHKREETTMKYSHPDDGEVRDGQNSMG